MNCINKIKKDKYGLSIGQEVLVKMKVIDIGPNCRVKLSSDDKEISVHRNDVLGLSMKVAMQSRPLWVFDSNGKVINLLIDKEIEKIKDTVILPVNCSWVKDEKGKPVGLSISERVFVRNFVESDEK